MGQVKPKTNHPSFLAGALFIIPALLALWQISKLDIGDAASMGPGYMPRALAIMLLLIGMAAVVRGFIGHAETLGHVRLRPIVAIFAAVAGFAVILALKAGLVIAAAWLLAIGSLATSEWRAKEVFLTAVVLIPFTALVFVVGLGLQMQLWPW